MFKVLAIAFAASLFSTAQVNVLTGGYGRERTNANLQETTLTPANVTPGSFGKLGVFPVDGQVYAQPLYVSGLSFPGQGGHNVLFVFTQHNSVYAYDADAIASPALLWHVSLGQPVPTTAFSTADSAYDDIKPEIGILSTGAVDLQRGVIYAVSSNFAGGSVAYWLHALSLTTGQEQLNGPVAITASVPGEGAGSADGRVAFDPLWQIQRPALLLANNAIYVAFGSHGDALPFHGWLMTYNASDLSQQLGVFNTSPNGFGGSIWESGRGLAGDDSGAVYGISGNGDYDGATNFGESFLKFTGSTPQLTDWFTPANWQTLSDGDYDLAAGPALISGTHTIIGGDKNGQLYAVNANSMGHLAGAGQIIQGVQWGGIFNLAVWSRPAGAFVYVQEQGSGVKSYQVSGGTLSSSPVAVSATAVDVPYQGMSISASGTQDGTGILWETTGDHSSSSVPGTLHAFDAGNLSELWNSDASGGPDALGMFAKFANPTIANGKVYAPTFSNSVAVYGLLGSISGSGGPKPVIAAVSDAASYSQAAVSPGEMVTIFGSNLGPGDPAGTQLDASGNVTTMLSDALVLFDGIPAPMIYAGPNQISAVAPFELTAGSSQVQVAYQGKMSDPFPVTIAKATPAIFSFDSSGTGEAAALNQDYSLNSSGNPAAADTVITLYATGAGQLSPTGQDGTVVTADVLPAPVLPVAVQIGGEDAQVLYAGGAPGLVEGILQVNVQIPHDAPSGTVPLTLWVGHQVSQSGITLEVQDASGDAAVRLRGKPQRQITVRRSSGQVRRR